MKIDYVTISTTTTTAPFTSSVTAPSNTAVSGLLKMMMQIFVFSVAQMIPLWMLLVTGATLGLVTSGCDCTNHLLSQLC